jgi:hypothetical protein
MKHLLLILTIGTAFACRPSLQKCNDLYGHCGRIDTLTRTIEYRDTTVITDSDTLVSFVPVMQRDTLTVNRIIERYRKSQVKGTDIRFYWVNDSTLKVESICPRDTVRIKGKDRIEVRTQVKTERIEVMPGWVKWVGIGAGVFGFLMLLGLILALIRR